MGVLSRTVVWCRWTAQEAVSQTLLERAQGERGWWLSGSDFTSSPGVRGCRE